MRWRLIDSDLRPPAYTAAADEAILIARNEGAVPNTLHLYRRNVPTVSLGHFERAEECVDLDRARADGVHLVRRMSGGSAVYTDPGQLIYALILQRSDAPWPPPQTFERAGRALIEALAAFGLRGEFKPVNDVLVGGRKISGSAQVRRWNVVAQHGTVLVDTDLDRMSAVLRSRKRTADGMTTLARELGRAPPMEEVKAAVVEGFSRAFGTDIAAGAMTEREEALTARLVRDKYGTSEHTYLR